MSVRVVDGAVRVVVRVKPKSKREGVEVAGDVVTVRVRAPPVDGKANERVTEVVAEKLGIRASDVVIVRGETARDKELEVRGLPVDVVNARLCSSGERE